MEISKALVGGLAALCLTSAAGGAYFASRSDTPADPVAAADGPAISPDPAAATVDQSEALVASALNDSPSAAESRATARPAARAAAPRDTATRPRSEPAYQTAAPAPVAADVPRPIAPPVIEPIRPTDVELRPAAPPQPEFEELVVAENSVVGLEVESSITSEQARVEDEVVARVTRDVRVGDRVAIPAGSKAHGEVTLVERGGRVRERARLGIRFTSVVLADGTRVPLNTETIYREGDAPGGESAAKIGGGTIGGAIIGGILGGAKGAIIGGSVGAGAGTAAVMAGGRNPATLPSGTDVTVRVIEPTSVTVEK
jgi:hypothetical protein